MRVITLYNPNSTGDSKLYATQFHEALVAADSSQQLSIEIQATEHAGHGEEIAASYAKRGEACIIISASGDGGYHEVINGALSSPQSQVIVGILPAGNANDHYNAIASDMESMIASILAGEYHAIDALCVQSHVDGAPWTRYAHSYAGIGVVARAAKDLTDKRPNRFTEKWLVAKSLLSFSYVKIRESDAAHRYSSLVFSNVDTMSKIIKLADDASLTDGKFEINYIRFRSKLRLLLYLATAATVGLKPGQSASRFTFTTTSLTNIQLDGEVYTLDAESDVVVTSAQKQLRCVW